MDHPTPGSPPQARADARANRERLLEAALAVFADRGLGAEMKEIADRAGVGIGTIYRNFATKDDLVGAVINRQFDTTNAAVESLAAIEDPAAAVAGLLKFMFSVAEHNRGIIEAMRAGGVRDDCIDPDRVRHHLEACTAPFLRGVEAGVFRDDIPVEFLGAFLFGQFGLYLEMRMMFSAEVTTRYCTELVLRAIRRC